MNTILYDADCGICTRTKQIVEALDWFGTMRWVPNNSSEAAFSGIPQEHLDHAVYFLRDDDSQRGFAAIQQIAARLPLAWIVAAYVVAKKPWTAFLFVFLLSPLASPVGEPLYDLVARNRYRLPGSTCDNQIK